MPKPSVLPVPVLAWPMMSCPCRATGRVSAWIGKGEVMPTASSASTVAGSTPRSANVGVVRTVPFNRRRGSRGGPPTVAAGRPCSALTLPSIRCGP